MYVSPREGFQMAIKLCPDLASSYYAKAVNYFREAKLKFVEEIGNPAYAPAYDLTARTKANSTLLSFV